MPITDSIGQLIEGVSFVFGRLCSCHSVIALGGQFSWNWSKVAVNRDLLNVERAVWFPVFWTCHRPHHVSGVRGPGNGSLFFRWIAYVIYSGSCLIPLRRSPSATAMNHFLCDWMLLYFHNITCSTSLNCFLPMQIHQQIIQCSFCELFYDSIHNKWYKSAALFSVCILDRWEPDHSSRKIKSGFILTNDQISSVALVATGSIIIWYCSRFSLVVKKNIACRQGHKW